MILPILFNQLLYVITKGILFDTVLGLDSIKFSDVYDVLSTYVGTLVP